MSPTKSDVPIHPQVSPTLLLLYWIIPDVKDWREALFSGHFGE